MKKYLEELIECTTNDLEKQIALDILSKGEEEKMVEYMDNVLYIHKRDTETGETVIGKSLRQFFTEHMDDIFSRIRCSLKSKNRLDFSIDGFTWAAYKMTMEDIEYDMELRGVIYNSLKGNIYSTIRKLYRYYEESSWGCYDDELVCLQNIHKAIRDGEDKKEILKLFFPLFREINEDNRESNDIQILYNLILDI